MLPILEGLDPYPEALPPLGWRGWLLGPSRMGSVAACVTGRDVRVAAGQLDLPESILVNNPSKAPHATRLYAEPGCYAGPCPSRRPRSSPRPTIPTPRTKCSQSSAVFNGTKLAAESLSMIRP